jgi:hypothetical protein
MRISHDLQQENTRKEEEGKGIRQNFVPPKKIP